MFDTYQDSLDTTAANAKQYEAKRLEIVRFYEGNKGQDLAALLSQVSDAVKAARADVAKRLSHDQYEGHRRKPAESKGKIYDLIRYAKDAKEGLYMRPYHGENVSASQLPGIAEIEAAKSGIIPEHHLDPLAAAIVNLANDEHMLPDQSAKLLEAMTDNLKYTKNLLEATIKAHNVSGSIITSDTAAQAYAALNIIEQQLLPTLERSDEHPDSPHTLQERIDQFASRENFIKRHGNAVYDKALKELAPAEPVQEIPVEAIAAPVLQRARGGIAGDMVKLGIGAALGGGLVHIGHETGALDTFAKKTTSAHVRPVEEMQGYKSILNKGPQKPSERGDANSVEALQH